jgi:hypothetical protein
MICSELELVAQGVSKPWGFSAPNENTQPDNKKGLHLFLNSQQPKTFFHYTLRALFSKCYDNRGLIFFSTRPNGIGNWNLIQGGL